MFLSTNALGEFFYRNNFIKVDSKHPLLAVIISTPNSLFYKLSIIWFKLLSLFSISNISSNATSEIILQGIYELTKWKILVEFESLDNFKLRIILSSTSD